MISEKLKMDYREFEVERAHRTGKTTTGPGDRPKPIVVKFLRFKDKVVVLERAKNVQWQETVCEPFGITWILALIGHQILSDFHLSHNNRQTQCD